MAEHTYYPICDQCVRAEGDECHTPGCALFLHDTPDHQIHEEHGIDLARVRRDAAREALDGLIADKAHITALLHAENGGNVEDVLTHYRDTHYGNAE